MRYVEPLAFRRAAQTIRCASCRGRGALRYKHLSLLSFPPSSGMFQCLYGQNFIEKWYNSSCSPRNRKPLLKIPNIITPGILRKRCWNYLLHYISWNVIFVIIIITTKTKSVRPPSQDILLQSNMEYWTKRYFFTRLCTHAYYRMPI